MESNIRKLRLRHNISQKKLGEKIGVSQQMLSRIERDRERIPIDILMNLADYFQVSTDYILGYERKRDNAGDFQLDSLIAAEVGTNVDYYASIEKLEYMHPRQKRMLWNLLVNLKNIL